MGKLIEEEQQFSAAVMIGGKATRPQSTPEQRQASLAKKWRTILLL